MPSNFSRSTKGAVALAVAFTLLAPPAEVLAQGSAYEELQTFSGVLNHIRMNYVDSVTYTDMVRAAIDGVLHSLDPHSAFFSRRDWERRSALDRGELAVSGMAVERVDDALTVLVVADRSPAAKVGVAPGDRLLTVNDTSLAGLNVEKVALLLAGDKGTKLRVRLERGPRLEPETLSVTVKLDYLKFPSVSITRMADATTGYVRLSEFGMSAAAEVHTALKQLKKAGAKRVILDLRNNPGGYVFSAVDLASEFFPRETVVFRTKGRKRDVDTSYVTKSDGDFLDLPLVVLINEHSASAAEALAASLQDHDRALLIGRRSFGKALMQIDFPVMPLGDDLHLTIGYVISPSGRVIQRRYRGLGVEQYRAFAGRGGSTEDTLRTFKTDNGRVVRGGGGVVPDITLPAPAAVPMWWTAAADSGFDEAIVDSVAQTLSATPLARQAWLTTPAQWQTNLVAPFLARVRSRFQIPAQTDSALAARLAVNLALRTTELRWGGDARDEFLVQNDGGVRAALTYFPRLAELLHP
jgi:carboxyl-terminal processing protease